MLWIDHLYYQRAIFFALFILQISAAHIIKIEVSIAGFFILFDYLNLFTVYDLLILNMMRYLLDATSYVCENFSVE